jgi:hypothetical protein
LWVRSYLKGYIREEEIRNQVDLNQNIRSRDRNLECPANKAARMSITPSSANSELHSRPQDLFALLRRRPNIATRPHLASGTIYFIYSTGCSFSHSSLFAEDLDTSCFEKASTVNMNVILCGSNSSPHDSPQVRAMCSN